MLLADAAQAVDGKLYILGGGWSIAGPGAVSMAIALKLEVPWDRTNERHHWQLDLVDGDGHPVLVQTGEGAAPLNVAGELEVGRPVGVAPGTPIDVPMAINLPPLPLPPGRRLVWRLTIDGETREDWQLAFTTRS